MRVRPRLRTPELLFCDAAYVVILRARAHCDAVNVECGTYSGPRYACSCESHACVGRLVAGSDVVPDAGTGESSWAIGELKPSVVLDVIMQHAADVKACHALAKKAVGSVVVRFDVLPPGTVRDANVAASSVASPALSSCLVKKVAGWRFPKAKGPTRVTYGFQFSH